MIIHIIGSIRNIDEDMSFIQTIAQVVRDNGNVIAHNWIDSIVDRRSRATSQAEDNFDWTEIVESNTEAIKNSGAIIVEGSRFNYSQGYQTAIALQYNKPVLNLYRTDLPEYKEWPDKLFVSGVSHQNFISKSYKNEEDLKKSIIEFLENIKPNTRELEIKLNLDLQIDDRLEKLATQSDRTKSSLIKEIIEDNISQY